ncbi:MAG: ABC transporter permease [bacterium]
MFKVKNQEEFLKTLKREKFFITATQTFILIFLFLIWELLSENNIINSFIYSSPSRILETIFSLYKDGSLFTHIYTTIYETIIAFTLGISIGFIIAIILYEFKIIAKIIEPFLVVLNSLPKVALGPLIIIIVGANTKSIIVMALLINLIINITTIYSGFLGTDENTIKLFDSLKASSMQKLRYLIIPSSGKIIISSLKLNISTSLIGVIMGEFLTSKAGLGYLIIYGTQVFNLNLVMSGILILALISFILYKTIEVIEKKLIKN